MKISFGKVALSFLLASFLGSSAFGQARIATIDLSKAFNGYWKKREAESTLKDRQADLEKELKSMLDELKKGREALQKLQTDANDIAVSNEERDKRKKAAEDKLKQVKDMEDTAAQYNRTASTSLEEQKKRVRDNLITEIKNVVSSKAKAGGYSFVIDTAAETINGTPFVLYSGNEYDLTAEVLADLNTRAPKVDAGSPDDKNDQAKKGEKKK